MTYFRRICPNCNKEIFHKSERACKQADKNHKQCKECGYESTRTTCQSQKFRESQSKRILAAWAIEGSIFRTVEHRKKLSESQKSRDPSSYEKASFSIKEAWRREKENPTGRVERMTEANKRAEVKLKRSESLKRMYQEHPEKRIAHSDRAKLLMLDPDYKSRCTKKLISAARRTGGTSKYEKQLAEILSDFGFVHKQEFGRWCVDFYNPLHDVVVELYGDWWHCHPKFIERIKKDYGGIHPNIQMTPEQIIHTDNQRIEDLINNHVKHVVIFWESDIITSRKVDQKKVENLLFSFCAHTWVSS